MADENNTGRLVSADKLNTNFKIEWEDIVKRGSIKLTLSYEYSDIAEQVERTTSYLGKMRATETAAHLLDIIAMTKDEGDLFNEYIDSAAADIYDSFAKFTGNTDSSFKADGEKVEFVLLVPANTQESMFNTLSIAVRNALAYSIIYHWLLLAYPDEVKNYAALYDDAMEKVNKRVNTLNQPNTSIIIPRVF